MVRGNEQVRCDFLALWSSDMQAFLLLTNMSEWFVAVVQFDRSTVTTCFQFLSVLFFLFCLVLTPIY